MMGRDVAEGAGCSYVSRQDGGAGEGDGRSLGKTALGRGGCRGRAPCSPLLDCHRVRERRRRPDPALPWLRQRQVAACVSVRPSSVAPAAGVFFAALQPALARRRVPTALERKRNAQFAGLRVTSHQARQTECRLSHRIVARLFAIRPQRCPLPVELTHGCKRTSEQ
ncbi:uncharacterized protein J3D65DRAFT_476069 [Phyllosticta citribraziliensis]|uniref:Uncharacterized protein n=1 Tax=Phyllosticta citribraziliensis TaxID=989973 RepID=A0ABR1LHI0_9PEZI